MAFGGRFAPLGMLCNSKGEPFRQSTSRITPQYVRDVAEVIRSEDPARCFASLPFVGAGFALRRWCQRLTPVYLLLLGQEKNDTSEILDQVPSRIAELPVWVERVPM